MRPKARETGPAAAGLVPLTESRDLRGGRTSWEEDAWDIPPADPLSDLKCDVAVIGAGVMGSILAERLSADGHSVLLLDRRSPGMGSTAASTAELMWAMDVPLSTLAADIGEAEAARRWTRVYRAVRSLAERIDRLGIDCARVERPTVYLAGDLLDASGLRIEAALHACHGLPSEYLNEDAVARRFGIRPRAAIVSEGGFEVDPVRLAHGMLEIARARGARIHYPCNVVSIDDREDRVTLLLADGIEIEARQVVLASGYERATLFLPPQFELLSTFVIATSPGTAPLWGENAMIWEASDPYLYVRTDDEGRVIAGGEDADLIDARRRDDLIGRKAGTIAAKLMALLGSAPLPVDRAWSATFGSSPDGLPAIGLAANMHRVWLSAGFGGNGIAFAALASELLSESLAGRIDPDAACFDPYRFSAKTGSG